MSTQVFTLPDLGEGLTEAELVRWLVKVGDVDAPVAEVETAKATVEVPSPFGGVVAELHGSEGETIAVGAPLISVSNGAGDAGSEPDTAAAATYVEEERAGSGNVLIGYGTSDPAPSRRRRARGASASQATAIAPTPTATPASTNEAAGPSARPAVQSPIVRNLARGLGLDLTTVTGTGPHGLITRRDVEDAAASPATMPTALPEPVAGDTTRTDRRTGLRIRTRVPLCGMRKAVTETVTRSRTEIPEATTWVDVDATALLELRASLAERGDAPGLLAMVARFLVAGLVRFPELNARVDTEGQEIVHLDGVNLGIAAQAERGLVVPAVREAHKLGMRGLHGEIRRLTAAARDGSATATELSSGSFTLNNYGMLGVDGSAAIINHPEVAILGMGRIILRPWVVGGEIVPRSIVQLSLVFDHRVCDGGTAGGFLRFVADAVENPTSAMADL
ncbi:MAG: dihydrolipoamide acetyltransferase family protein [Pseudonocardiaceae bacterium]